MKNKLPLQLCLKNIEEVITLKLDFTQEMTGDIEKYESHCKNNASFLNK